MNIDTKHKEDDFEEEYNFEVPEVEEDKDPFIQQEKIDNIIDFVEDMGSIVGEFFDGIFGKK